MKCAGERPHAAVRNRERPRRGHQASSRLTSRSLAGPPSSAAYRLRKFVGKRNRAGVLAGSTIAMTMLVDLGLGRHGDRYGLLEAE